MPDVPEKVDFLIFASMSHGRTVTKVFRFEDPASTK